MVECSFAASLWGDEQQQKTELPQVLRMVVLLQIVHLSYYRSIGSRADEERENVIMMN
jgi:hypothetical protein